jgi:hypothetical protein
LVARLFDLFKERFHGLNRYYCKNHCMQVTPTS